MADLFDGYGATATTRPGTPPWDEMFASPGTARASYKEIHATLAQMTQAELRGRTDALASSYLAQGVTFDFAGEERPFPLDIVPRILLADEWSVVEAGVVLTAFLVLALALATFVRRAGSRAVRWSRAGVSSRWTAGPG